MTMQIKERACGGWIAYSEVHASLKIGVTADTEDEAREAFFKAAAEWAKLLSQSPPIDVTMFPKDD